MTSQTYNKTELDNLLAAKADGTAIPVLPTLAAVATTGAYSDLTGTPTIPATPADIGAEAAGTAAAAVAALTAGASTALDTLAEIDAQLAADEGSAAALAALVAGKADAGQVSATTATLWKANTAYAAGQAVVNPAGFVVTALTGFTSGANYSTANWSDPVAAGYAAGAEYPYSLPAGTVLGHRYDPIHQAYNVTADTMRLWNAAKARTLTGGNPARVLTLGHSVVVGTSDSNPRWQYSFATKLRNLFNARYGPAGTGLVYLVTTALSDDARVVFNGTWATALGNRGAYNAGCYNATGTGNTITFTPDIPVDSFTVYYVKNTVSGTFSASVDGGTPSTANAFGSGTESLGKLTIPAGTLGAHTLTITPPASQQVYVVAVEGTVGASGVRVSRCGRAGASTSTITTAGTPGADSLSTIFSTQASPDLTVVMCEINDYNTAVPVATFTANLTTIVQRAQATGSVLVVVDETILTQPNSSSVYQSAYHAAIYSLAETLGFGVFDVASRWKDYATSSPATPGFYANATADPAGIHPSAVGHQDIANGLFSIAAGDYNTPATTASTSGVYLPEWQPNTAYTAGQYVLNPSGQIVSANTTFTSGSTYTAGNWTAANSGGGGTSLPGDAIIGGYKAWPYDAVLAAGSSVPGNASFTAVRVIPAVTGTITNVYAGIATAAATPTAGGCAFGIYDANGTRLGTTADIGSSLTSTGFKAFPLTAGVNVTAGTPIYIGFVWNGTTGPALARASAAVFTMVTATGSDLAVNQRFGALSAQASLPASFAPASLGTVGASYWFGVA